MPKGKKLARVYDGAGNLLVGQPTQALLIRAEELRREGRPPPFATKRVGPGGWWDLVPEEDAAARASRGESVTQVEVR